MALCPECKSEIPEDALVCRYCCQRIKGKQCPQCLNFNKAGAKKCSHCSHDFDRDVAIVNFQPFEAKASLLATILLRLRLLPQKIELTSKKITITTYGYFYLTTFIEEIPWEKIAGYHFKSGLIWDQVVIETRGQTANYMSCLRKKDSTKIKDILEKMKN
jgi:hypothetical protein